MSNKQLVPSAATLCAVAALLGCNTQAIANSDTAPAWQGEALESAANLLEDGYIYEDKADQLAEYLRSSADTYAAITDRHAFAQQLTEDLFEIVNDRHLRIVFNPETGADEASTQPAALRERPAWIEYCRTAGIEHTVMDSNVGYIQFPNFMGGAEDMASFDTAMTDLSATDGLILDLRDNCGGGPQLVRHLSTYFFADTTHLVSTQFRGQDVMERWTFDAVPGERYLDRPLVILTNEHTFSAAESFTFGMKVTGRAMTVGVNTGGGGHFGGMERVSADFEMFVPVGRTFDPRTGEGWEAEGIEPDLAATSDDALAVALSYLSQAN
jgi:C-terminal processing protease CtpA/Prc